jgi:5-oxoprolinase (ATP-hydrolysing)
MALADVVHESSEPSAEMLNENSLPQLHARLDMLQQSARMRLLEQGFTEKELRYERYLNLRYQGTSTSLMIQEPRDGDFEAAFCERHLQEFSFKVPGRKIHVDDIRVRGIAVDPLVIEDHSLAEDLARADADPVAMDKSVACSTASVYFEGLGWVPTDVYKLEDLPKYQSLSVSCRDERSFFWFLFSP